MAKFYFLCLGLVAATLSGVSALSKEELDKIQTAMLTNVQECNKNYGISEDVLKTANEEMNPDAVDPCFIGCVFKKSNIINDKGLFEMAKAIEISKKYFKEAGDQAKFTDIVNKCSNVNDEAVSDGEKGCDRSKLLLACFTQHKDELVSRR